MKRFFVISVLLVILTGFASSIWAVMLDESFEGATFPPAEWTTSATAWESFSYAGYTHNGVQAMKSGYSPSGDWWIMTPRLRPSLEANQLSFWYRDYSESTGWDYADEYTYVMVSTTGYAPGDFTTTLWTGSYTDFTINYQQATIDLSAYNGMDIYIAFKSIHTGGNYRIIDDVYGINFAPVSDVPLASSLMSPDQDGTGISMNADLNWNPAALSPTGYRVYFDTVNPPVAMVSDQTGTSWSPTPDLNPNTQYWWQVVPYNANGDAVNCPIWNFTTGSGYEILMSNGSFTVPAGVSVGFFDTGGAVGTYQIYEDYTFTFYPQAGYRIKANFSAFSIEDGWDYLTIYDGADATAPAIGTYSGDSTLLGDVLATGPMTFAFTSDSSVNYSGWAATITNASNVDVPAGVDTDVNGVTVNSSIDLYIDATVTPNDPILMALPTYDPAGSTVMSFDGSGTGDLTVSVPAGTWFLGLYDGAWHWSVPNPFNGAGTYTFVGVNYGAKADAIVLLTPVNPTLPVELSSFTAVLSAESYVNLTWVTESETGVQGFNVYRNETADLTSAVRINSNLIGATNTSQQQTYNIVDNEVFANTTYYYWLENIDMSGVNAIHGPQSVTVTGNSTPELPQVSVLSSVYPNPFHSGNIANFDVAIKAGETGTLTIYNLKGQTVKTYSVSEGNHTLQWDGKGYGSGVYFYKLTTPTTKTIKKLVIAK